MPLSDSEALVAERLRGQGEELERLLGELVGINSHTANHEGVNELGRLMERRLMAAGLKVGAYVTGRSGQHLVARTRTFDGNRLLLLGHLDTVYPPDHPSDGFRPDPADDSRLLGPGVTDMKGGLTAMLAAVTALAEQGFWTDRALTVVLCADEETGSPTGHDIIAQEAAEHHLCLVLETGSLRADGRTTFVTERRGFGRVKVEIEGVEAHSGSAPGEGVSAALEMAHKIIALEALNGSDPAVTVNVGVARAGTAANTVPGRAVLEIDYRFSDSESGARLQERLDDILGRAQSAGLGGRAPRIAVEPGPRKEPMTRTDAVGRMAARIKSWGADLGLELEEELRGGGSDGNITSAAGCPTVDGLGTVGGAIHSDGEWVQRSSLVDRACLLAVTMMRFHEL